MPGTAGPADADVLAIFSLLDDRVVDFGVDLRELRGRERLDVFWGFSREIGQRLGMPVLMDPEGDHGNQVLGFDVEADRVVLLAEPMDRVIAVVGAWSETAVRSRLDLPPASRCLWSRPGTPCGAQRTAG